MSTSIFVLPTRNVDERGLATTCSQCDAKAMWYGTGGIAYCDEHWPGERYEWTRETRETETKID